MTIFFLFALRGFDSQSGPRPNQRVAQEALLREVVLLPRPAMVLLGAASLCAGLTLRAASPFDVDRLLTQGLVAESFLPVAWLGFSLSYSRGDYRESLLRWRIPLAVVALLPIGLSLCFQQQLVRGRCRQVHWATCCSCA